MGSHPNADVIQCDGDGCETRSVPIPSLSTPSPESPPMMQRFCCPGIAHSMKHDILDDAPLIHFSSNDELLPHRPRVPPKPSHTSEVHASPGQATNLESSVSAKMNVRCNSNGDGPLLENHLTGKASLRNAYVLHAAKVTHHRGDNG
ncbi:hypothetical protein DOTSEDRAFT_35930 [Dothistroma septosporum NZE10]|uniref:Uncharacterized protein n=1 Tax=Dothistroma septosporum (strain NZE10 / CBS 128990) TaxID=675120 RepID=N1PHW0_DOTSN|nr:hypothetical protein DOTSEDRAFT_35930 [Dothistroma septosporum NZE10]